MAKNYSKKEGNASIIFIWILIILLAVGTLMVFRNFKDHNTSILKNTEVAAALSEAMDKPVGRISKEDIASVEGISLMLGTIDYSSLVQNPDGTISLSSDSLSTIDQVIFLLKGYNEQVQTGADSETLSNYMASATLTDTNITDDLAMFTGLKVLELQNNTEEVVKFDLKNIPAESVKALDTLSLVGYEVEGFETVADMSALKTLYISNTKLEDVSAVKELTGLESLLLEGEEITDASPVEGLTGLKNLYIDGTSIEALPDLTKLVNLENVDFSNNGLTDISALSVLDNEKIQSVNLIGNEIEDFSPIAHIDEKKVTKDEPEEEETEEVETTETTDTTEEAETADKEEA